MGTVGKSFSFLLIIILAGSILLTVKPASAQTTTPSSKPIPKPSAPEFTVKYINSSYEVPASSSINPYTGQKVTNPSHYVDNESTVITITNQPFVSYIDNINGHPTNISLFYNVQMKGHYAANWTDLYSLDLGYLTQSNSKYTITSYTLGNTSVFGYLPPNTQIDFQVEALIGYVTRENFTQSLVYAPYVFNGQTSGWSNTQTITIPTSTTSPTSTPTIPEFPSTIISSIFIASLVAVIVLFARKRMPFSH
jgi:hypothetical protein